MLLMGPRPEELLAVETTHIDLFNAQLQIVEGKSATAKRSLKFHGESMEILTRLKGATERPEAFTSSTRNGISNCRCLYLQLKRNNRSRTHFS
jgi:hypothetical protein